MIDQTLHIGIDVSKDRLDVHIHPLSQSWTVPNSQQGFASLIARLVRLGPVAVGIEASGGYERRLADALCNAMVPVYILAPARVRGFARALGQLAKTDAIDAAMIARYLATARAGLSPYVVDPVRTQLSALLAHRSRLIAERSGLASQRQTEDEPLVLAMIAERLGTIAKDLGRLEEAMRRLIAANPALRDRHQRLCRVPGVGPVLARTLLADMPELGHIPAKSAAALIGVAPHARQSGRTVRAGRCWGGRKHLRDIAYMAVLSAIKMNDPVLAGFYKRLRTRGKPFKLAMVATIRKLITILNAIARTDPEFKT